VAISFRSLSVGDLPTLAQWLAASHVKEWWPEPDDLASVRTMFLPMIDGTDSTEGFVILCDGNPIGFIQRYRFVNEPEWQRTIALAADASDAAGIDYLIGEVAMVGRGLGSVAIRTFVAGLWKSYADVARVIVAVQQLNVASWRALENAGFKRVWTGQLETEDPSDQGPAFLYAVSRPSGG
jgi:aminoglycoside 6'-N-acetyltransferase